MHKLSYENRLLLILFFVFGGVFFDRLALAFLFPNISEDLHLTNAHLGMLSAILALTWAISGAGLGLISDKFKIRKPMLIAAVLAFSAFSAFSGMVSSFIVLLIFRACMGVAEGPVLPIAQSLMVEASNPKRRGLNMGLINGAAPGLIGAILGPPIILWMAASYGWRTAFYLTCIPGLIMAFLIYKYVDGDKKTVDKIGDKTDITKANVQKIKYIDLFKNKNILLCILISCFFVTWFMLILNFTPSFLVKERGFSSESMGFIMSAVGFAWVFWGILIPALSDRVGRKPILIVFSLIAISCPYFLSTLENQYMLGIAVFLSYTGLGCFTLFMATIPSETVPKTMIATALGLIMGIGEIVGGCIVPFVAGFLADSYGLVIVMWIAAFGALVAGILACFLDETAPIVLLKRKELLNL